MENIIKTNNELLKMSLESIKPIKAQLEKELHENYSDETFNRLESLNKEIEKAERLIDCTSKEGQSLYAEFYPDRVDKHGDINSIGLKRLGFLEKKFGFSRFFKK